MPKAKEEPCLRFHALIDKVWRADFLMEAWAQVRRNGGSAGVDGETVKIVESYGVDRWLGNWRWDLKDGTYKPKPVRQVLIPKKQPGKFRPVGIPLHQGSGGPDVSHARADADLRGRSTARTVRLQAGAECPRRDKTRASPPV